MKNGRPATQGICCARSEEHTSELQSHSDLVCRLLLEKKKADVACTFAANRALGSIVLAVRARAGVTGRSRLREEGPLRVGWPGPASGEVKAVIGSPAG